MSYIIKFFSGGSTAVASVVWPIILGAFLAVIIAFINKRTVGMLIKKLLEAEALSSDKAKSLKELGLEKKSYLKYALRDGSSLSSLIKKEKTDSQTLYYIPEERAYRAEAQYKPDGSSVITLVICAILFVIAGFALVSIIPKLLELASAAFK